MLQLDATLLSNFTHQIINPLNGVVGTIDNLVELPIPEEKKRQRMKAVRAQLQHTIELVRNLAYLAQLSTTPGRETLKINAQEISVPLCAIEASLFFQELAAQKSIRIHVEERDIQYMVVAHKPLLMQVFMNVLENCVKYGDDGSDLRVECHAQKKNDALLVHVVGAGPGFLPTERDQLFSLGFRGQDARELKASGSGLGLYIAREILKLYDASIEAEYSPATRRTVFRFRFPMFRLDEQKTEEIRAKHRNA